MQRFSLESPSSPIGRVAGQALHTHRPWSQVHWVAPKKQLFSGPGAAVQALEAAGCCAGHAAAATAPSARAPASERPASRLLAASTARPGASRDPAASRLPPAPPEPAEPPAPPVAALPPVPARARRAASAPRAARPGGGSPAAPANARRAAAAASQSPGGLVRRTGGGADHQEQGQAQDEVPHRCSLSWDVGGRGLLIMISTFINQQFSHPPGSPHAHPLEHVARGLEAGGRPAGRVNLVDLWSAPTRRRAGTRKCRAVPLSFKKMKVNIIYTRRTAIPMFGRSPSGFDRKGAALLRRSREEARRGQPALPLGPPHQVQPGPRQLGAGADLTAAMG